MRVIRRPSIPSKQPFMEDLFAKKIYFDYDAIFKSRVANLRQNEQGMIIMEDPYNNTQKIRFEHSWRDDPVVRQAINKKVDFIIGERPITVLDTKSEYSGNEEAAKQAFNNIVGNQTYQEMKSWIDNLNASLNYHSKLKAAMVQMKVFGRSVLYVEKYDDGTPADLKLLNSEKLGEVVVDNDSWNLYSVQYDDYPKDANIILAENMIYFTNLNYNITPNTLWYGYSEVEPVAHISECNRIIDQVDLKEINAKLWAGLGVIKFLDTKDPAAMQNVLSNFKSGTWMATDANVDVIMHKIEHSLKDLVAERNENDLRIARGINVPSFLVGFENITNRATVKALLESWKVSVVNPERVMIKNIVEPQWYDSLVDLYLAKQNILEVHCKIKQEFEDIIFDNVKDRVESYLPLYEQQLITGDKLLRLVGLDSIADEAKALEDGLLQQTEALKQQLSLDIDRLIGSAGGSEDMKTSIETQMIKSQIVNDIDTKIKDQINFSMKEYIEKRLKERVGKIKSDRWKISNDF